MMVTSENIRWLKQDLYTCGLNLNKLSELPDNLEKLLNIKLEVTKRTHGENENVYLNRRIVLSDQGGCGTTDSITPF
jgi:molybdopterin-biosynthesis enzyme MoeA-like protein